MTRRRKVEALAATAAAALAVAGCGGSSGAAATAEAPPRMTKSGLAERLGDVCQEHTDRQVIAIERFEKRHDISAEPTEKQLEEELTEVILPIVHDTIHDVGGLRPPADEEAEFEAFIRALEHGVAVSEKDPSWVATGDSEPFGGARKTSAALGTYYCGQA
jgi:hypothetical protein